MGAKRVVEAAYMCVKCIPPLLYHCSWLVVVSTQQKAAKVLFYFTRSTKDQYNQSGKVAYFSNETIFCGAAFVQ